MDYLGYRVGNSDEGALPQLVLGVLASRYWLRDGEIFRAMRREQIFARDAFSRTLQAGVSANLMVPLVGNIDGHNVIFDSNIYDMLAVDRGVPCSPLFGRDLAGRVIYLGYGPEVKEVAEWGDYIPAMGADGKVKEGEFNPFVTQVVFPRHCREVEEMDGKELLEEVFLTKFRCLEMSMGFSALPSGMAGDDDAALVGATYAAANLYPYKLRLDTFYTDGWRLPQMQMVFARRDEVDVVRARKIGAELIAEFAASGEDYATWLAGVESDKDQWFERGCTLIPTFEACNGYCVVGRGFELEDYWPGRAVVGLHIVVEERADKAPAGTILQVLKPGYVTADHVEPAEVVVSDGSGYVSPNVADPLPFAPNLYLPHQRTLADWRLLWVPTHPEHFEHPAIWGWNLEEGRFMQLMGPIWDPLHYYYGSVDEVLKAYENPLPKEQNRWLVPVPEHMKERFYPVVPMHGFDTMSAKERARRREARVLPRSCLKRIVTAEETAGVGYHPLPAEFEFELDPFWFPELHPLNREQLECPEDVRPRLVPIIRPKVTIAQYLPTVDGPEEAEWLKDESRLLTPADSAVENYPQLTRYLLPDMEPQEVMQVSPVPFLSDIDDLMPKPAEAWWVDEDGKPLDGPEALESLAPGLHEALWDARQTGVELVKFRHMVYQTNLPLYMLAWWHGANIPLLQTMYADWMMTTQSLPGMEDDEELNAAADGAVEDDGLSAQERAQLAAMQSMRAARHADEPVGLPEERLKS